ncbi:MAG: RHS repeat-associated core domain-containing protein, partial [Firmicutes bacterium]|nr:RHS repeat-associated core domain-containing protein [Bacillota bacterium]
RRLNGIINALGQSQNYGYDPAGNLTSLQAEGKRRTTFQYNPCHHRISETDSLGATVSLERDALGRVAVRKGARGKEVGFAYDPDGLMEKVFHDRQEVGSYRHDTGGRLIETDDESGKITFEYDEAGRIKRIAYPEGMELSCTYNAAGLVESITYPGELTVCYTYDNRMRPAEISWRNDWVRYTYDAAGNLMQEMRSNGTESNYQYDENGRLVTLEHGHTGKENFIKRRYIRDAAGTILEEEGFQPLMPPGDHDFNFSCNIADQIADAAPSSFRHDADGNLVSAPGWTADYDADNRLVELTRDGTNRRYLYNSLGHRVRTVTADSMRHRYHDPLGNLIFEAGEDGAPRFYLYCHCRPVAMVEASGGSFFYHYDQGGNTLALTAEDSAVAVSYAYSPFGRCISSDEKFDNPFTFCGASGVTDEGEDLYFMKKRFYSASWGRFVQKDPLGLEGGINPYAYAANNPLTYIDPDGALVAEAWLAWKTVGAIVGVVTLTAAAAKTAYNSYKTGSNLRKEMDAISKANKLYKEYQDICKKHGQFGGWEEKEVAYWKYEQAHRKAVEYHNNMTEGMRGTATGIIDVGTNVLTSDALNLPITIYEASREKQGGPYPSDPRNPCGNHIPSIIRKEPRLHY